MCCEHNPSKNAYAALTYQAFHNCTSLQTVTIGEGMKVIGHDAFAGCINLAQIDLPASVTDIAWSAFENCPNLTIHAPAGSYAERYARSNKIPFVAE